MSSTFKVLGDAAKLQLTGRRAGLLIAAFDGIEEEELISVASQDYDPRQRPTALAIGVSRFLSSGSRSHVIGVGFFSRGSLRIVDSGHVDSGGAAYCFACRGSPMWSEEFDGVFASRTDSLPQRPTILLSS